MKMLKNLFNRATGSCNPAARSAMATTPSLKPSSTARSSMHPHVFAAPDAGRRPPQFALAPTLVREALRVSAVHRGGFDAGLMRREHHAPSCPARRLRWVVLAPT